MASERRNDHNYQWVIASERLSLGYSALLSSVLLYSSFTLLLFDSLTLLSSYSLTLLLSYSMGSLTLLSSYSLTLLLDGLSYSLNRWEFGFREQILS